MDVRNGYVYNVNDTWAPSPCETCTCIETGEEWNMIFAQNYFPKTNCCESRK